MFSKQELKKLDLKELHEELQKARRTHLELKLSIKMQQDKKSHNLRKAKRYVAQIMTLINATSLETSNL